MGYNKYKKFTAILIIILTFLFLLFGCSKKESNVNIKSNNNIQKEGKVAQKPKTDRELVSGYLCKLTGETIYKEDEHQTIAVMINNEPGAIPQSSLNQAEFLYEALIEGGATRIMAIYHHTYPQKVGPIRSARPYFMQIAKSIGAYYVHCGGSPQAYRMFKQNYIPHIDAIYTGGGIFYRSRDRKAPHNLYSTMKNLVNYFEKKGYKPQNNLRSYPIASRAVNDYTSTNSNLKIRFSGWYYVQYKYDPTKKVYLRFIKQRPHVDKETNIQLWAKNLVILIVKYSTIKNDDSGRQEVDMRAGKGYVFQEGKTIPITYTFDQKTSFALRDLKGKEINLLKGNTWFELVPQYGEIKIE